MEILFAISVTAIVYFVALYFVSKLTVDKWGPVPDCSAAVL